MSIFLRKMRKFFLCFRKFCSMMYTMCERRKKNFVIKFNL